ncbi:hypothetical protein N7492_002675 [Penicillium capsulatum]|uniref:Uncharacterized protein n=1 Tax=Penicillium capsulatum TaxID=69766 RepID=A0A9W9IJ08_9EURO|nr:hypothetical protein N7492_002675 [Penicillium capsulatum]KAJ6122727.1 hypothetical protein N7512_005192 [Penicillium capsulatum]
MQPSLGLQVSVASQLPIFNTQPPSSLTLKVSIENQAPSPVTVLKWGTPLDTRAGVLGIFQISDTDNGQTLPTEIIKISRKLPASAEDLVEIPASHTMDHLVTIPGLSLEEGHHYSVQAQGIWHAVWDEPLANVSVSQLTDLTGAQRGEYLSNVALLQVE